MSTALVPIARTALAASGRKRAAVLLMPRTMKRARTGVRTARNVYGAATRIQRAWRRSRKARGRLKHRIGKPRSTANSKRRTMYSEDNLISTRTLYFRNLVDIPKGTTNSINERDRHICYISGFKLCFELLNRGTPPMCMNLAVVYDKRSNDTVGTVSTSDFFRGGGSGRASDFSNSLSSNEFRCLPMNKDRFTILWHRRIMLGTDDGAGFSVGNHNNYRVLDKWLPLKKQITWEDGDAQSKIWLLWWCDGFDIAAAATPLANQATVNLRAVTYFRETK